jgi:lipopolysaccharide/colanic/teichoic acid biosynthesis glycosyltransferase
VILLAPVIVVVACLVRARLGRGVIYRQRRVGKNDRVFTMYKFRTMAPDRRAQCEPFVGVDRRCTHKCDDDPRHTKLGRALRRWSLDEIPQLWNVMVGQMSLVGPRPELAEIRHLVKPVISGLFQISPDRAGLLHEHVDYDLDYVTRCGFWRDMQILMRTPRAVCARQGH